jgi:hypothetical protein
MRLNINPNVRNVAIVLIIAALVVLIPGGGTGANVALQAASLAFLATFAWVAFRLYREHRVALYSLGDSRRLIVYAAVGAAAVVFTASHRMFATGAGTIAWIALIAGCAYAVFAVVYSARKY